MVLIWNRCISHLNAIHNQILSGRRFFSIFVREKSLSHEIDPKSIDADGSHPIEFRQLTI